MNLGFSYAGIALDVGADLAILSTGTLAGDGHAEVRMVPPFVGTVFDRYYVQAVTSTAPNFEPLQASHVGVVRNGDLVTGLTARAAAPRSWKRIFATRLRVSAVTSAVR